MQSNVSSGKISLFPLSRHVRKALIGVILASFLLPGSTYAAEQPISVSYYGSTMKFEVDPILEDGTTLVQFRPLFEKIGLGITWNASSKSIRGMSEDGKLKIDLQIGSKNATVNGIQMQLEVAPKLVDGNTMVPLRFVSEATGKRVSWNPSSRSIAVDKGMEVADQVEWYGGQSYDPDNYSALYGRDNANIFEKDGKMFVIWDRDVTMNNDRYTNFYISTAKDGKWLSTASIVRTVKRDRDGQNLKFISGDTIYWRNSGGVQKWTINSYGTVSEDVYAVNQTFNKTNAATPEILNVVYRPDGETGVLFGDNVNLTIYFKDRSYPVKDLNRILFSVQPETKFVLNERDNLLNIYQGASIRQLDIVNGDLRYDKGKDKTTSIAQTSFATSVFTGGKMNVLFTGNDQRVRLVTVDQFLNISQPILTNYFPKSSSPVKLIDAGDYFHLWENTDFNRRPSINYVSISK